MLKQIPINMFSAQVQESQFHEQPNIRTSFRSRNRTHYMCNGRKKVQRDADKKLFIECRTKRKHSSKQIVLTDIKYLANFTSSSILLNSNVAFVRIFLKLQWYVCMSENGKCASWYGNRTVVVFFIGLLSCDTEKTWISSIYRVAVSEAWEMKTNELYTVHLNRRIGTEVKN